MLNIGDRAPDFELPLPNGETFKLAEVLKDKDVVLYFYPKDETSGCTAQACEFRDQYDVFKQYNAEVIGVSSDSETSHEKFAANHNLNFILLSDKGNKIRKLYEVPRALGLLPGRVTYLIDQKGIIRYIFNSLMKPIEHINGSLEVLKTLSETK